jgi:hypothetical protein
MFEAQLGYMKYTIQLTRRIPVKIIYALYAVELLLKNHFLLVKNACLRVVAMLQLVKSMNKRLKV